MVEIENNFQTMDIIYKMKKIKKSKKIPKKTKNLQNIETFQILENLPKIEEKKDNIIEGFDNNFLYGLHEDEFEGGDDVNSQTDDNNGFTKKITDFINELYIFIILFNCRIAFTITNNIGNYNPNAITDDDDDDDNVNSISYVKNIVNINVNGDNNTPFNGGDKGLDPELIKDSNIIYQYTCFLEALIAAFLFTNVWYYNIFYNYYINKQYSNFFDYLNRDSIKENIGKFSGFILFFFGYAFAILEDIRWFFEKFIPKYGIKFLNKPLLYILLFLLIYKFNHESISHFKDLIINMITSDYTNIIIITMVLILGFIVIYEYVKSFHTFDAEFNSYLKMFSGSIFQTIYDFIKEIIRLIIIIAVAIPLGLFLCFLYFFYISFFGSYESIIQLKDINFFIRNDIEDLINPDPCNKPKSFWDYIKNTLLYLSMSIYNYLFFIIIIIYCIYILSRNLESKNLQLNKKLTNYLQGIHIPILIISIICIIVLMFKYKTSIIGNDNLLQYILLTPDIDIFVNLISKILYFIIFLIICIFILFITTIIQISREDLLRKIKNTINKNYNKINDEKQKIKNNLKN